MIFWKNAVHAYGYYAVVKGLITHVYWMFLSGVRGHVVSVAKSLMTLTSTTCPSPLCVRISPSTLDSYMWGSYPAVLQNVGGSTEMSVCALDK
jgi:hypothetical protein